MLYRNSAGQSITFWWLCTMEFTRKDCKFLYLVHNNAYNWMNEKLQCFSLVMYLPVITYFPHVRMFHTYSYDPTYVNIFVPTFHLQHKILYKDKISISTYLQTSLFQYHHTLQHTHMIKHRNIFLRQPVNIVRKYCTK